MSSLASIKTFLEPKELAIAGVSRNPKKFGRHVYDHLREHGYKVYPVNPNTDNIDGDKCYPSIQELPSSVDRIFIVTPPGKTEESVKQTLDKGIRNVWIQQKSDTPEALELMEGKDINLIHNKCIFMFAGLSK